MACQSTALAEGRSSWAGPGLLVAPGAVWPEQAVTPPGPPGDRRARLENWTFVFTPLPVLETLDTPLPAEREPPRLYARPRAASSFRLSLGNGANFRPCTAMPGLAPRHISVFPSPQELGASLAQLVAQRAAEAGGRFSLGLSGGSLVRILAQELPAAVAPVGPAAPAHWLVAFCDERLVPVGHADSTFGAYQAHLLSKLSIPESQVVVINPSLTVEEAASDYAEKLKEAFQGENMPVFDLLILGIGPDGHTCSLFPDHPLLQEKEKIVASISNSPKPPAERITLTLPVLNAARTVVFVATGESKAAILKRILEGDEENPLPAALVLPHTGKLHWFLDESAAKELTVPFEKHSIL